jgi:hypothetical protein
MEEVSCGVQRKKSICPICEDAASRVSTPEREIPHTPDGDPAQQSVNTTQCAVDAIKVAFQRIQARTFAKSSPDTRT